MVGNEQIDGRVFFPAGADRSARPLIKLQSLSSPEITAMTDQDGNFRFTHLRPDAYTVVVDGGNEYEKASETVVIGHAGSVPAQGDPGSYALPTIYPIQIYLKLKGTNSNDRSTPGFANVAESTQILFRQALESVRAGNHSKAIEQLKKVISEVPRFAPAYNELAVQFLKVGQADRAADTLKEALKINPDDFTLRLNYGIALLNQKKFDTAEAELRLATKTENPNAPRARFYLGMALINEQKFTEAQPVLENVIKNGGDKLPLAHKYLGGIYWRNKQYREAADELDRYLKLDPKAADADKIQGTIKELRRKS
jgi:Tfp pilus assembly protein PilF